MQSAIALRLLAVLAVVTVALGGPAAAAGTGTVNCAEFGNRIDFTLRANLEITEHGAKCVITGTVDGNVTVMDPSTACHEPPAGVGQQGPQLTAANLIGGSVLGNIKSSGGRCAMVWLRDGSVVDGNVIYRAAGNLGFLDVPGALEHPGATVRGNVILKGGRLWATGSATTNRIDGNLICNGGAPRGPEGADPINGQLGSGTETDWDGAADVDGTLGGQYIGC
jgi:hypothetical protein